MSPLPGLASFSTATTAVGSQGAAYPSIEEFTSFKLPPRPEFVEPNCDDISAVSDDSEKQSRINHRPVNPTPPSPVSTESSDHQISDGTPTTVRGESVIFPKHPLSVKKHLTGISTAPRWPFQDATPRASVMAPITHSQTQSSFMGSRNSPTGQVGISESLDEFQLNHPNAHLLALHPPSLAYNNTRNLANVPEVMEKSFRSAQHETTVPMVYKERHLNFFHGRRWSGHLLKFSLHRHHAKSRSAVKPTTFWWQRIATQQDMFVGSCLVTVFCVINALVSVSALVTLGVAHVIAPAALIVWVIVSLSTCLFTCIMLFLMRRFRRTVLSDEEVRGRSTHPKVCGQSGMRIPASPREVAHRRRLAAASEQDQQTQQNAHRSVQFHSDPEVAQVTGLGANDQAEKTVHPDTFAVTKSNILATGPRQDDNDQIENYWTDISLVPTSRSEDSSITAVITSAPPAPTDRPRSNR